jgi:hypothetical protein
VFEVGLTVLVECGTGAGHVAVLYGCVAQSPHSD